MEGHPETKVNTWLDEVEYSSGDEPVQETKMGVEADETIQKEIVAELASLYLHIPKAEIEAIVEENELNVEATIEMLDQYHKITSSDSDEEMADKIESPALPDDTPGMPDLQFTDIGLGKALEEGKGDHPKGPRVRKHRGKKFNQDEDAEMKVEGEEPRRKCRRDRGPKLSKEERFQMKEEKRKQRQSNKAEKYRHRDEAKEEKFKMRKFKKEQSRLRKEQKKEKKEKYQLLKKEFDNLPKGVIKDASENYVNMDDLKDYLRHLDTNIVEAEEKEEITRLPDMKYDEKVGGYEGPDNFRRHRAGLFEV